MHTRLDAASCRKDSGLRPPPSKSGRRTVSPFILRPPEPHSAAAGACHSGRAKPSRFRTMQGPSLWDLLRSWSLKRKREQIGSSIIRATRVDHRFERRGGLLPRDAHTDRALVRIQGRQGRRATAERLDPGQRSRGGTMILPRSVWWR